MEKSAENGSCASCLAKPRLLDPVRPDELAEQRGGVDAMAKIIRMVDAVAGQVGIALSAAHVAPQRSQVGQGDLGPNQRSDGVAMRLN